MDEPTKPRRGPVPLVPGGVARLPEYKAWSNMKARCLNENCSSYKSYGARGVTVWPRWVASFEEFFSDMGPKPSPEHSLDRYPDTDGDYKPSNCRWATPEEQGRPRSNAVFHEVDGKRLSIKAIAAKVPGLTYAVVYARLSLGWPLWKVLAAPVRRRGPRRWDKKRFPELSAHDEPVGGS